MYSFLLYSAMAVACTYSIRKREGNSNVDFREGKASITLSECIEIKNAIGTEYSIDYLFAVDNAT